MRPSDVRPLAFLLPFLCLAQAPTVGVVEIYGARTIPIATIRKAAGVVPGGRLPASKAAVEENLIGVAGVHGASVEAACCEDGKIILYIGVVETGPSALSFREDPTEGPDIPEPVTEAYRRFLDRVNESARASVAGEDLSQGHSLMTYAPAREAQMTFVGLAKQFDAELRAVLRTSPSEDHRAMAAYVLQYHEDKKSVIEDLTYALRDADATVRENAARALAAIATYGQGRPEAGVMVDPGLFTQMLNSVVWRDRNNAAVALVSVTESRPAGTLALLRQQALPALVEMARWKHLPHALPAYILLGRTAGIPEPQLQAAWSAGEREAMIVRASGRSAPSPAKTKSAPPGRP